MTSREAEELPKFPDMLVPTYLVEFDRAKRWADSLTDAQLASLGLQRLAPPESEGERDACMACCGTGYWYRAIGSPPYREKMICGQCRGTGKRPAEAKEETLTQLRAELERWKSMSENDAQTIGNIIHASNAEIDKRTRELERERAARRRVEALRDNIATASGVYARGGEYERANTVREVITLINAALAQPDSGAAVASAQSDDSGSMGPPLPETKGEEGEHLHGDSIADLAGADLAGVHSLASMTPEPSPPEWCLQKVEPSGGEKWVRCKVTRTVRPEIEIPPDEPTQPEPKVKYCNCPCAKHDLRSELTAAESTIADLEQRLSVTRDGLEIERNAAQDKCRELESQLADLEQQLWAASHERDAYKRAKQENDERFMLERDAAQSQLATERAAFEKERQEWFEACEYSQKNFIEKHKQWVAEGNRANELEQKLEAARALPAKWRDEAIVGTEANQVARLYCAGDLESALGAAAAGESEESGG